MKDLFKLILGVLASLFKSRAKLEAEILILRQQINVGSVQNLSHIGSGDGSGLHDLRLVEGSHVHVALRRPSRCCDVAEPGCSEIET